jgi:excisionase family DNA binding protein
MQDDHNAPRESPQPGSIDNPSPFTAYHVWKDLHGRLWGQDTETSPPYRIDVPRCFYPAFLKYARKPRPVSDIVKREPLPARPDPMSHSLGGNAPPPENHDQRPRDSPIPVWFTIPKSADYLDCSTTTVKRAIKSGRLKSYRIPRTRLVRILRDDLTRFMGVE